MSAEEENAFELKHRIALCNELSYEDKKELLPQCFLCGKPFTMKDIQDGNAVYVKGDFFHVSCMKRVTMDSFYASIPKECTDFWEEYSKEV